MVGLVFIRARTYLPRGLNLSVSRPKIALTEFSWQDAPKLTEEGEDMNILRHDDTRRDDTTAGITKKRTKCHERAKLSGNFGSAGLMTN